MIAAADYGTVCVLTAIAGPGIPVVEQRPAWALTDTEPGNDSPAPMCVIVAATSANSQLFAERIADLLETYGLVDVDEPAAQDVSSWPG